MKKYLAYYENEWPANIAELTALENKPFVGYLKDAEVKFTVVPKPVTGPADNEIWYTSSNSNVVYLTDTSGFGVNVVSNTYENDKGVITFDGEVTCIGGAAFYYSPTLTSITIPNSVTSIGDGAFYGCSGLASPVYNAHCFAYMPTSYSGAYDIPEGIKQIASSAFAYCRGLTSITIPDSVMSIGSAAFNSCTGLPVENNLRYADTYLVEVVDKTLSTYPIKEGTKWIGGGAFSGCSKLTSITIPNSVMSITNRAFEYCPDLTSLVVEESNTVYDSRENCNAIIETATNTITTGCQNTIIPNSVTCIGDWAFYQCSKLTSITIPNSVTGIGEHAFHDCSGLVSITYEGTQEQWNTISKGVYWRWNIKATYVQCTDGQVAL